MKAEEDTVRYTIDPLQHDDPEGRMIPVVEVLGPAASGVEPIRRPDGTQIGFQFGREVGRATLRLTGDVETEDRIAELREAVRNLMHVFDVMEVEANGQPIQTPDEEAEARTRMTQAFLLAHAALAIELETGTG